MNTNTTIVAPATGNIVSALGMIRMSGKDAIKIMNNVFTSITDKKDILLNPKSNTLYYGKMIDKENNVIDEVVVSVFLCPHSYTGEDTIEISHHGSLYIQKQILILLIDNGATMAQKGEFSQRAFLNKKMNLSQIEAVADLISSNNKYSHSLAYKQLRGGYQDVLKQLRQKLLNIASLLELELDFSEEQEVFIDRHDIKDNIDKTENILEELVSSFSEGNAFKNGIPVAIVGKPNSGKSTLLNTLLNEDRSIVSNIEGTTRDTVEETMFIDGIEFRFIDTAGIRNSDDEIEKQGVKRSFEAIEKADIVLYMLDMTKIDNIKKEIKDNTFKGKQTIYVLNKCDVIPLEDKELLKRDDVICISALKKQGIDILKDKIKDKIKTQDVQNKVLVSNVRHYEIMKKTLQDIRCASKSVADNLSGDLIAEDIRQATSHLGQITGEITTQEVLNNIFKNFCIGK